LWQIKSGCVLQKEDETSSTNDKRKSGRHNKKVSTQANERQIVDTNETSDIPEVAQQLMPILPQTLRENTASSQMEHNVPREAETLHQGTTSDINHGPLPRNELAPPPSTSRRSGRWKSSVMRLIEVMAVQILAATAHDVPGEIYCCSAACQAEINSVWDQDPLYGYKTHSDPDTMYMHQAMRQPDKEHFVEAMKEEITSQVEGGVYSIIHKDDRPQEATLLPAVWQMQRKRNVVTGDIKRYKARLNIDGSRMVHMRDYDLTYAPVASWASIKLLLAMTLVNHWHTI
jgi:hypothetical protein